MTRRKNPKVWGWKNRSGGMSLEAIPVVPQSKAAATTQPRPS